MPFISGNTQFGSLYQNPQMKMSGGSMTPEQQWYMGQSQTNDALNNQRGQSQWIPYGFDPTNPFGRTYYNSNPLIDPYQITPGMAEQNTYDVWQNSPYRDFINPSSNLRNIEIANPHGQPINLVSTHMGTRTINPYAMQGMFGTLGASGGMPSSYKPGVEFQAPEAWGGYQFDVSELDPNKAIQSWEPYMAEQRDKGFAEAAQRMGQSGMAASTPYANALGEVSRKSADDLARIAAEYQYRAQESMAQRDLERQMAEQQASLGAWGTQGGWDVSGQLANLANDFGAWQQMGNWQMQDRANQQNQQNMLMSLLGSFMGV